ncbi:DAAF5 factor, partial [Amia calva]|nr:DAAF5 factor [Amia calva]
TEPATAMASAEELVAAGLSHAVARQLNCLTEDNKNTRKRALDAIRKETLGRDLSSGALQGLFDHLLKPLLRCLSDPMEKCRETSIQMLGDFIRRVPRPEDSLPYLVPALTQRLGGPEILRLALLGVLGLAVELCGGRLAAYVEDVVKILQRTLVDPFPDAKKESCRCTVSFARAVPEHFHMQAESLVKPLMQTISHQHSRVRVAVIEATGAVIQFGNAKSLDDVLSHFAQRLFDNSPQVRQAVTTVVGSWLLNLRDRYSYFHKLIPLLLSSFSDEILDIRLLAADYWKKAGCQWQQENEDDLKDKLDFLTSPPSLYPAGAERPELGCRELVFRNLSKMLPAVSREITDWVVGTRVKSAQLLAVLLLHAEDHATQHMELLLSTLYRACADEEREVVSNSLKSAELIGTFVSPEVFLKLILGRLQKSSCSPAHLMVLGAVLRGSSGPALVPHLGKIAHMLSHPDVGQESEKLEYLEQLLCCVQALLSQGGKDCREISLQLLKVLVTIQSLSSDQQLHDKVLEAMGLLSVLQDLGGPSELFGRHMAELMEWLAASQDSWTGYSVERLQFEVVAIQSGPAIGGALHQLLPLLKTCLQPSRDAEMRLKLLTVLSKLLLNASATVDSRGEFAHYLQPFLQDILLPNLVWQAGRTSAAVRTAAVSCLWALLCGGTLSQEQMLSVHGDLLPHVIATLDEDSKTTRHTGCRVVAATLRICGTRLHPDALNTVYPELLKRLDDACDEVRLSAAQALSAWFRCAGDEYRAQCGSHLEFLFRGLLVYLDDPDSSVQGAVFEVLKEGSAASLSLLQQEIEAVKEKHRSPVYCDQLLRHISALPRDTA